MKPLFKPLTPTISSLAIVTIASCACNTTSDKLVSIPKDYLNIEDSGKTLNGLKAGDEGETKDLVKLGYSKLTIGKDFTKVEGFTYSQATESKPETIGYKAITKVEFIERTGNTSIEGYAFTNLPELTCLEFPKACGSITLNQKSFFNCSKLSTLDFSKVETFSNSFTNVKWADTLANSGTLYANSSNKTTVESIKGILGLTNWIVKEK